MFTGIRPDITPAQVLAVVGWVVAQAVAFGYLDTQTSQLILSVSATVVAAAWKVGDAIIRNGRNHAPTAPPVQPAP